jgi:CheY-like chemotaxis protein
MAKILIVDDQQGMRILIDGILKTRGHAVESAVNSFDAIAALHRQEFDLVITDLVMPGSQTGYELIRQIRSDEKLLHLPIIVLSGKREFKDVQQGIEAGADGYLVKPIEPPALLNKIDVLLAKSQNGSRSFEETSVFAKAVWQAHPEIRGIAEVGVSLASEIPLPVGFKLKIKSEIFDKIGLKDVTLRVIRCKRPEEDSLFYAVNTHFIGLTAEDETKLKAWVEAKLVLDKEQKKPA